MQGYDNTKEWNEASLGKKENIPRTTVCHPNEERENVSVYNGVMMVNRGRTLFPE